MNKKGGLTKIRLATKEEAGIVASILYGSFVAYKALYTENAFAATTPDAHEIESRINENTVWIVLHANIIAGTITLAATADAVFIRSVAVVPGARGQGLGRALMRHAEEMAAIKGARDLHLTTTFFLREAINLYKSFGYTQTGYDDLFGTALIIMKNRLKAQAEFPGGNNAFPLLIKS